MLTWLNKHLENSLCCLLLAIMASVIFLQVISRTFGYSLSWTEELARFCLIWLVYIGVSLAAAKQKHIQIEAVVKHLSVRERLWLSLLANSIFYLFAVVILFFSSQMVTNLYLLGQTSPALGLAMWWVYLAAPFGFALASIRLLQQIVITLTALQQPQKA